MMARHAVAAPVAPAVEAPAERAAPDPALVAAAMSRLHRHRGFRSSPNLVRFLDFVVGETLAGRADRLKAYTVATAALGRGPEFDPATNPIVRVEATRLRRKLDVYYATDGADDPLRIRLAVGAYRAEFERRAVAVPADRAPAAAPAPRAAPPPLRRLAIAASVAAGSALVAAQLWTVATLVDLRRAPLVEAHQQSPRGPAADDALTTGSLR